MRKQIKLMVLIFFTGLFFVSCAAKKISISASTVAYHPKTIFSEGVFTFNPDEIIPDPKDTEKRCRPVAKYSPIFGENEEIQLRLRALKCGPHPLYYQFTNKYYGLDISFIIDHEKLKKIKKFRIQLDSSQEKDAKLKTPKGEKTLIYFEGGLLEK